MYSEEFLAFAVDEAVERASARQILQKSHSWYGGFFSEQEGCASPSHIGNAHDIACGTLSFLGRRSRHHASGALLERLLLAIEFQCRCLRPEGLVDLPQLNPASPPDTAFSCQLLAAVLAAALNRECVPGSALLVAALETWVRKAAIGIAGRGFHTPNHRWVIASALTQVRSLFPDLDFARYVDDLLAEGIDANADGEYSERSNGIYNAVSNRSIRLLALHLHRPDLLEFVVRNLDFMSAMLDHDGRVETLFSTRQDRGSNPVPVNSADTFFALSCLMQNGTWASIAHLLARHATASTQNLPWLLLPFFENLPPPAMPEPFADIRGRWFPAARVWRFRKDRIAATMASGEREFFSLRAGDARLAALRIQGSYSDCAHFTPEIRPTSDAALLLEHRSPSLPQPRYHLPLPRPVPFEDFEASKLERKNWNLPPMGIVTTFVWDEGFHFHVRTEGGLTGIQFQIEFVFDAPGLWETGGQVCEALPGATAMLTKGFGTYRCRGSWIRLGPGADEHRVWHMRSSPPAPSQFRVLVPLLSPLDHRFSIEMGEGVSLPTVA